MIMELIDKAEVVAKITKIYDRNRSNGYIDVCNEIDDILSFLDTLEVKEVNLDRAIDKWIDDAAITHEDCSITDIISTAKYFFELGLKIKENKVMPQEEKVDLEIEIILWTNAIPEIRYDDVKRIAEYFYELGIKSKGK